MVSGLMVLGLKIFVPFVVRSIVRSRHDTCLYSFSFVLARLMDRTDANVANVVDRVSYVHRRRLLKRSREDDDDDNTICSYTLPVEIGLDMPDNGSPVYSSTLFHYARLVLRVVLRNPGSFDERDPVCVAVSTAFLPNDATDFEEEYGGRTCGSDYLMRVSTSRKPSCFVLLMRAWYTYFYRLRSSVNWMRFVETGELKFLSATGPSSTGQSATGQSATGQSDTGQSTTGLDDAATTVDNTKTSEGPCKVEDLLNAYDKFIVDVRRQLQRFHRSSSVNATCATLKTDLTVDDVRLVCYLFYDMFDVFDRVLVARPTYHVDGAFLRTQFRQARTALLCQRLSLLRRLFVTHQNFSKLRDWLYLSDVLLRPLQKRFDLLLGMDDPSFDRFALRSENKRMLFYLVNRIHQNAAVIVIHDLLVRYLLHKYFRRDVRFNEALDPYSPAEFVQDNDIAHFFVFLVNRCLNEQRPRFTYTADDQSVMYDHEFWRCVLSHCASIAPNTFVAQVYTFVVPHHVGPRTITFADLLDYVDWLCADDPWYRFYTSASVERLRSIEEHKLAKHVSALYENECILFYVLVEKKGQSVDERIRVLGRMSQFHGYYESYDDDQDDDCSTERLEFGRGRLTMPVFNWHTTFQRMYSNEAYGKSVNHAFCLVADFFRYLISRELRELPSRSLDPNVLQTIQDLLDKRSSKKNNRKNLAVRRRRVNASSMEEEEYVDDDGEFDGPSLAKRPRNRRRRNNEPTSAVSAYESSSSAAESNAGVQPYTFSVHWAETDASTCPAYAVILQKTMNFLNSIYLMSNGQFANTGSSDFMSRFTVSVRALKHEQSVWSKDPLLRVFTDIFQDFDIDSFQNASRRPLCTSVPSFIIGNSISSISGENLNFVRVSSKGSDRYILWNLTTRKYEPGAPSLLYLLTLDSVNWSVDNDECYPSATNDRINEYTSFVLQNLDEFTEDVQRVDALSMMLYSEMIPKKRIGESMPGAEDADSAWFFDRIARTMTTDLSTMTTDDPIVHDDDTDKDALNVPVMGQSSSQQQKRSEKYVHFLIDREEFFALADRVPVAWVYEYAACCLRRRSSGHPSSAFLRLLILIVQLVADRRMVAYAHRENFAQRLADEMIESSMDSNWLRRQKWTNPRNVLVRPETVRRNKRSASASSSVVPCRSTDGERVTSLARVLEQQLNFIDVSCIVAQDDDYDDDERVRTSADRGDDVLENRDGIRGGGTIDRNVASAATWQLGIDRFVLGALASSNTVTDGVDGSFINNMLTEREFHVRMKQLLRDKRFARWTFDALSDLTLEHVRQLDDVVVRSTFKAYVYVVRHCSNSADANPESSESSNVEDSGLGSIVCDSSPVLLSDLHSFFPSRFVVNQRTLDLATAMTKWMDERFDALEKTRSSRSTVQVAVASSSADPSTGRLNFDDLVDDLVDVDDVLVSTYSKDDDQIVRDSGHVNDRVLPVCPVHDFSSISYSQKLSLVYVCLVVYIFCDLDTATTYFLFRLVVSFLYPGIESRNCVIVRGSSGSGKSQFFELIRKFLNSTSGLLNTQTFAGSMNGINTQLLPVGQNFVCQCDEPRRVDNETLKLLISPVQIAARAMHNQQSQSIPIMAKLVFTVNNMFQIVSDDGVQERLHSIFHLSHKHYNLVNEHVDMRRYNCGCSWNVSHQLTERVFPRDVDANKFLQGLFHMVHHWSGDQIVRTDSNFLLADQHASSNVRSLVGLIATVDRFEPRLSRTIDERESRYVSNERSLRFLQLRLLWNKIHERLFVVPGGADVEDIARTAERCCLSSPFTLSLLRSSLLNASSSMTTNLYRTVLRYQYALINTDFVKITTDEKLVKLYKDEIDVWLSMDYILSLVLNESSTSSFSGDDRRALRYARYREHAQSSVQKFSLVVNSGLDSDVNIDVSLLPCTLDLNLLDARSSLDAFVRFKHTHVVEYCETPISREQLHKQLNAFVDETNQSIEDSAFQIRYKDFHSRFETEYRKWCYRRPDTDVPVSNLWCVRIRRHRK